MVALKRILIVLAALCSVLITGFMLLVGAAMSMTDRFNGPHTGVMALIGLVEATLLYILFRAYR